MWSKKITNLVIGAAAGATATAVFYGAWRFAQRPSLSRQLYCAPAKKHTKVCLLGASGGIGQPLALLLKLNKKIGHLALYDIVHTPGVAADLGHICTNAKITAHTGPAELASALKDADVVVIPAGVPRKPGMTRQDLFNINAGIVRDLCDSAAKNCPKAMLCIITNPVNSTVPIAAEVYKKNGVFDPKRIFGVTMLDIVRANTFIGEIKQVDADNVECPVIGGHAGVSIVPVLSQCKPPADDLDKATKDKLVARIQEAGTEVVKAKAGAGSATLSMAYAGATFVDKLLDGMHGKESITCALVKSDVVDGVDFFATKVQLGPNGVEKNFGLGKLDDYEKECVKKAVPELQTSIQAGVTFMNPK